MQGYDLFRHYSNSFSDDVRHNLLHCNNVHPLLFGTVIALLLLVTTVSILHDSCSNVWSIDILTIDKYRLVLYNAFFTFGFTNTSGFALFSLVICQTMLSWYTIGKITQLLFFLSSFDSACDLLILITTTFM